MRLYIIQQLGSWPICTGRTSTVNPKQISIIWNEINRIRIMYYSHDISFMYSCDCWSIVQFGILERELGNSHGCGFRDKFDTLYNTVYYLESERLFSWYRSSIERNDLIYWSIDRKIQVHNFLQKNDTDVKTSFPILPHVQFRCTLPLYSLW